MIGEYLSSERDYVKIIGIIIFSISVIVSTFFFFQINQKNQIIRNYEVLNLDLSENYNESLSVSSTLRSYYSELGVNYKTLLSTNEELQSYCEQIQDDIDGLTSEYLELVNDYDFLLIEKLDVQESLENDIAELVDIVNLNKNRSLDNQTLIISSQGNQSLTYELNYSGYVEINFNSSSDIIIWVGSSISDDVYYARIPFRFPETAVTGTYVVPVCRDVFFYIINPSETDVVEVVLSITYHY